MKLREIIFEDNEESQRIAIQTHVGKEVILEDDSQDICWQHGILSDVNFGKRDYELMDKYKKRSSVNLFYHDLKTLLVVEYTEFEKQFIE